MPTTPRPTADLTAVNSAISGLQTDVGTLQTDVTTVQTDVGTLQTDVTTVQTDIGSLQTDVGGLQTDLDAAVAAGEANPAKGLVYKVYNTNVSVSSPSGVEEDGVSSGQTILLIGQSTASQNGAHVFNGNGVAMTRAANANAASEFAGAFWLDVNGDLYRVTGPVATLGTDAITIALDTEDYEDVQSTPVTATGAVTSITGLPADRVSFELYRNGARLTEGAGNDYTVSGNTATIETGVLVADDVYWYICRRPVNR